MTFATLEEVALQHFDDLQKRGELQWIETTPEAVESEPFDFEFRVVLAYKNKPQQLANDKGRTEDTNPFGNDDPEFMIPTSFTTHVLRLNKFSAVRPQFVLHTAKFERQTDPLSCSDFFALWDALCALGKEKYVGLYNCGEQAGSSIGHKHMQILPKPTRKLFPDELEPSRFSGEDMLRHPNVPFEHAILFVPQNATAESISSIYQYLCQDLQITPGSPHNVFLANHWIIVIPRTKARAGNSEFAVNAASMLGVAWVKTDAELQGWKEYGPMRVLEEVGVKRNVAVER